MSTFISETAVVHVPPEVKDLASFRRWAHSDRFPEEGRICFLNGEVWVDMSKEQVFTHNQVKGEVSRVLSTLVLESDLGRFFPDGMLLTNVEADLSCQPDGIFASNETLKSERLRFVKGVRGGYVELEGTPDMVVEVVSESSVEKDTVILHNLYWEAGIAEYWLVDARGKSCSFEILIRKSDGYHAPRKPGGWIKSAVFGKSFKLTCEIDSIGHPQYQLLVK
jgi:Uma2 family endonuclease